jgi:hypothetical protein
VDTGLVKDTKFREIGKLKEQCFRPARSLADRNLKRFPLIVERKKNQPFFSLLIAGSIHINA